MPQTDFRKVWDASTYINIETQEENKNNDSQPASHVEVEPQQKPERKRFKMRRPYTGGKTGNAFLDGVDAFNIGVETARDATVDAILHPIETATNLTVLAFDLANIATDKTIGIAHEGSKKRNKERKEAIVDMAKQFKEGDANTKIEMATTLGAGMIFGAVTGNAGVALAKTVVKKTAEVTRVAQKSKNLAPKSLPEPSPTTPGIKPSKQSTIPNIDPKVSAPKVKHRYPLRNTAARQTSIALSSTRIANNTAKLAARTAPVASRKPISRSAKASGAKESLHNHAPKPILNQYSLRNKGMQKPLSHKTVKPNVELKGLSKSAAVGLNEVSKTILPVANTAPSTALSSVTKSALECCTFKNNARTTSNAWKRFKSEKVRATGARELSISELTKAEELAELIYAQIRQNSNDIAAIAKHTGIKEIKIKRIKEHLFFKEHKLRNTIGKFDADPLIAESWKRLEVGKFTSKDIKLLNHELFESKFEGIFKTDYLTAHNAANRAGYISPAEGLSAEQLGETYRGFLHRFR